ncbi:hypothetical protein Tco_0968726 [Tanacetum coccineum]
MTRKVDILFLESLALHHSSPRPPEALQANSNAIESLPPSHIPVTDNDSLMEEIDLFLADDGSIPPGIESDDVDSVDDDTSISLPEFESFYVDYPNSGNSTIDVVEDIPILIRQVKDVSVKSLSASSEVGFKLRRLYFNGFVCRDISLGKKVPSEEVDIIKKTENQAKMTKNCAWMGKDVANSGQNGTMNEDTPVVVASATKEVVTQYVVYMTVEKEKRSCLEDTTVLGSFPPLPTQGKYGLVRSMFNSSTELFSFQFSSMDGLDAMLENGPWFILNNPLILKKWHPDENLLKEDVSTVPGRSSNARVMIELQADVELKDNIVVAMPKITGEGHYICNVRVEYEWRNLLGVPVGPKMGFKPQKEYRPVPKNPTASSKGNKKKGVEPTIKISNSNPFEVLNSVDNDVELELLTSGQAILMDEAGNPLKKAEFLGDYDSKDEVASVDNDMALSTASERVGFGTQSLMEQ